MVIHIIKPIRNTIGGITLANIRGGCLYGCHPAISSHIHLKNFYICKFDSRLTILTARYWTSNNAYSPRRFRYTIFTSPNNLKMIIIFIITTITFDIIVVVSSVNYTISTTNTTFPTFYSSTHIIKF